ncbi:MAG TPA: TlpA disulfide reductase family protein [Ilumatobacter sp.]
MAVGHRPVAIATFAGVFAAVVALLGGVWLARALDDSSPVDDEFVIDDSGVFAEPAAEVNPDTAGRRLPAVTLLDAAGRPVDLAVYRGAPLVVNFWFSRCAPCRRELRDFATVHAEVGDRVQFVGVDPFDTVAVMEAFAAERSVVYDLLRDDGDLSDALGIVGYPVTLFVDGDGMILRQTGEIDAETLRATIAELF